MSHKYYLARSIAAAQKRLKEWPEWLKSQRHVARTCSRSDEFCLSCGAAIPHRAGEGRCPECWHHDPEFVAAHPEKFGNALESTVARIPRS